jgi:hypothetical protein
VDELEILEGQLEEVLGEGATDPEDGLEIALVAGVAQRMGADRELLADAEAWRDGPGRGLLAEAFGLLDHENINGALDAVMDGESDEDAISDALYDIDELIAAAIWSGHTKAVQPIARATTSTVEMCPELFEHLVDEAKEWSSKAWCAEHYTLYGYWLAISASA